MTKEDIAYLEHINAAISKIGKYKKGKTRGKFMNSSLVQDGIIRQIEIIGEAVKKLSAKTKGRYPNIPWKDIAGMRDKLIHEYFGVDLAAVWDTVEKDIPSFKEEIKKILKEIHL